jgi:hypothetical protein
MSKPRLGCTFRFKDTGVATTPIIIDNIHFVAQVCGTHCHSAVLTGYIPIGIRSSHTDMTKFRNIDDPGFVAAASQLRRWIKESVRAERGSLSTRQLELCKKMPHAEWLEKGRWKSPA